MPYLRQTVAIWRDVAGVGVDDYNQPTVTPTLIGTERALIQPKSGDELAQSNQAGPVLGRYRVFMYPTDVTEGDQLITSDDEIYELTFVADAAGAGHHLEIDAERVYP